MTIKKVIIPIAGLATRFLPLSKVVPKELWPLVDKPVIQYIIEEVKQSGIKEIIFVISPEKKIVYDYFKRYYSQKFQKLEETLKQRNKKDSLEELKKLEDLCEGLSFSFVFQKKPLGDGHAILAAAKLLNEEPFAVSFGDDIIEAKLPCLLQLMNIFKTCQKSVLALYRLPKEKISSYGTGEVEKIANRLFKIKTIIEKPLPEKAPSDLAVVGKYILTPEIFDYLKKTSLDNQKEIILAEAMNKMLKDGKVIYGYEFEGKWLECGTKKDWLRSHFYLSLKDPKYGQELKEILKF